MRDGDFKGKGFPLDDLVFHRLDNHRAWLSKRQDF